MNLSDIRGLVKKYMDDPNEKLFTESGYNTLINESYRACFAFLNKQHSSFGRKTATGTIASGATYISMPSDFLSVYKLGLRSATGEDYSWMTFVDYEKDGDPYNDGETGEPDYACIDFQNSRFDIYPTSDGTYLYKLIYRKKLIATDEMATDAATPSLIPLDYHRWIVYETVIDALPTDDRRFAEVEKLQQKLESRIKSDFAMIQQASPNYVKGWMERDVYIDG